VARRADEGNQPADRHRRRRDEGGGGDDDESGPGRVQAEGACLVVADPQHVEVASVQDESGSGHHDVGQ
jgi:hypothetical protein